MSPSTIVEKLSKRPLLLGLLFVTILGYFTMFHHYWYPQHFFWDENYHIASAQKYLHGVYFMEPHPPLGKLLIALGEVLLHPNAKTDQFIGTDYAGTPPIGFSFAGYRFIPVLLAWLTMPLFYGIFFLLSRKPLWAVLLSMFVLFDNALIVHLRGAMLEGPLLFFSALTILTFLLVREWRTDTRKFGWASWGFGIAFACAVTTKVFSLIFVLLALSALWTVRKKPEQVKGFCIRAGLGFLLTFIAVWYAHIAIATQVNPNLADKGFYQASERYQRILTEGSARSPLAFPFALYDHIAFTSHYEKGVPSLDLCKTDENGSPFFLWPIGSRSINYRWETPDSTHYQYLYLQVNPAVWWTALLAVIIAAALLMTSILVGERTPLESSVLLMTFLALYVGFMAAVSGIHRVMYLYHYFMPLLFGLCLIPLVLQNITAFGKRKVSETGRTSILLVLAGLVFFSFQFFRPLSYYEPITDESFQKRMFFAPWELHCVNCEYVKLFGKPEEKTEEE